MAGAKANLNNHSTILSCYQTISTVYSGSGFVGFINNEAGSIYKEYIGACLTDAAETGTNYTMQVNVGFSGSSSTLQPQIDSTSPLDICIFGNANCSFLPFDSSDPGTFECPLEYEGNWVLLDCVTVSGLDEWVAAELSFTPEQDINAIILGPSCEIPTDKNYYFLDNFVLNTSESFLATNIEQSTDCDNTTSLSIANDEDFEI